MELRAVALVLLSAVIHATWNAVVKSSGDRLLTGWAQLAIGGILGIPFLWSSELGAVWPWLAASAVVEALYVLTLVRAYEVADLSMAYPIARGTAPALVALGGALFLSDVPAPRAIAGVGLVVVGILLLAGGGGKGLGWAVATGGLISIYTLIDTSAVRRIEDPLSYTVAVFLLGAGLLLPVVVRGRRGRLQWSWHAPVAGALSLAAYTLVLVAVQNAPVGSVAALRETSVVLGALLGWLVLGEPFGSRRLVAAGLVAAGAILLAMS